MDAVEGVHLLGFVAEFGSNLPLIELLDGLHNLDVDLSALGGIELPDVDLGALSPDL